MKTLMLLMTQYDAQAVVPVDTVCKDYFQHLTPEKFVRKVSLGEIRLPLIRMEASQKCAKDLHFHDLRHEGVSRLFEMGKSIPQAATVSGHRSWQSLKRYTHIRQVGDKYAGWRWNPLGSVQP